MHLLHSLFIMASLRQSSQIYRIRLYFRIFLAPEKNSSIDTYNFYLVFIALTVQKQAPIKPLLHLVHFYKSKKAERSGLLTSEKIYSLSSPSNKNSLAFFTRINFSVFIGSPLVLSG